MIWRIRDRSTFVALRRRGRRVREGPVTVTFVPDTAPLSGEPPKVAYAVGRAVGRAVRRNHVRRQLRSIMRELAGGPGHPVRSGAYLVSVGPGVVTLSYQELKKTVEAALAQLGSGRGPGAATSC